MSASLKAIFRQQNYTNIFMVHMVPTLVLGIKIGQKDRVKNACKPQSRMPTAKLFKYIYGSHGTFIR